MIAIFGNATLLLCILAGIFAIVFSLVRRNDTVMSSTLLLLSAFGSFCAATLMTWALVSKEFSIAYVYENVSSTTPLLYGVAALWASMDGSLMLWLCIQSCFVVAGFFLIKRFEPLLPIYIAVSSSLVIAFAAITYFSAQPFAKVSGSIPVEGLGLNSLLRNDWLMAIHPPVLYSGLIGLSLPFLIAVAGAFAGQYSAAIKKLQDQSFLLAWMLLGAGVGLGALWSYRVLGWGGYWAWDPVENASLVPLVIGLGYIHSIRKGGSQLLCLATFVVSVLATYLTRSGSLASVHAFATTNVSVWFLLYLAGVTIVGAGALMKSKSTMKSLAGDKTYLVGLITMVLFAVVVLMGTLYPKLVSGQVSIGPPFYERFALPVTAILLAAMIIKTAKHYIQISLVVVAGFALVLSALGVFDELDSVEHALWSQAILSLSAGVVVASIFAMISKRDLGYTGSMIAHIGFAILVSAIALSTSLPQKTTIEVGKGETSTVFGRSVLAKNDGEVYENAVKRVFVDLVIDGNKSMRPEIVSYTSVVGKPAIFTTLRGDLYATLISVDGDKYVVGLMYFPSIFIGFSGAGLVVVGAFIRYLSYFRKHDA